MDRAPYRAPMTRTTYDAVVVGGGHNGLTAAAYLARAGRSVLVLEAADHLGGATGSHRVFRGVDARLSRYSYLVSLMPRAVRDDLGLRLELRRRRIASYTPLPGDPARGLLVDTGDDDATRRSFEAVGAADDHLAWRDLGARTHALARAVFPGVTGPLPTAAQARAAVGEQWWADLHTPLGELVERTFRHDLVRGVVLTDALIGTFADANDATLAQNRCFLYHVIGGGTGDWDVPVGGMGAVVDALTDAARSAGAELRTRATAHGIEPDGRNGAEVAWTDDDGARARASPRPTCWSTPPRRCSTASSAASRPAPGPRAASSRSTWCCAACRACGTRAVDPSTAFAGTFHINESYGQLATAYAAGRRGPDPDAPARGDLLPHAHGRLDPRRRACGPPATTP